MGAMVSIVTGAGSGIGAATAAVLAARGDEVVCADVNGAAAEATAAQLDGASWIATDVSDEAACSAMVASALDRHGRVDSITTCAGIEIGGSSLDFDAATFRRILDVNVTGSFLSAQAAARAMADAGSGGAIVLIGSINSMMALPNAAAYCAAKGAIPMLARALAVDLAPHGIRVNAIGPGVTDTPMSAVSLADPDKRAQLMSRVPLARPADPAEMAEVVAFLTSEASGYITGAFLPVDGGWLAG